MRYEQEGSIQGTIFVTLQIKGQLAIRRVYVFDFSSRPLSDSLIENSCLLKLSMNLMGLLAK
jgi:hypothetical protein